MHIRYSDYIGTHVSSVVSTCLTQAVSELGNSTFSSYTLITLNFT